jgi:decaprenylphosphoryl-5-phosphoribose phosphatase
MRVRALDQALLRALRTRGHSPAAERAAVNLARAGEWGAGWIGLALVCAAVDRDRRRWHLRSAATVAGAFAANYGIKLIVRRPRPDLEGLPPLGPTISRLSYPSAHATTSFTGAGMLSGRLPPAPLYAAAAAMALSRPYLGVHYPSDVVAGVVLGAAIARLAR